MSLICLWRQSAKLLGILEGRGSIRGLAFDGSRESTDFGGPYDFLFSFSDRGLFPSLKSIGVRLIRTRLSQLIRLGLSTLGLGSPGGRITA